MKKKLPPMDALERQNPLGLRRGDLSTRLFGGQRFHLSIVAPAKHIARSQADFYRGRGVKVRVVKVAEGWGLYTR